MGAPRRRCRWNHSEHEESGRLRRDDARDVRGAGGTVACHPERTDGMNTLRNARGMEIRFIERGGAIVSWTVPDRDGRFVDVVPGYDTAEEYATDTRFLGTLVGR